MSLTTELRKIFGLTKPRIRKIINPFQEFFRAESASGIILIAMMLIALLWANSRWSDSYTSIFDTTISLGIGNFSLEKPFLLWINDGLMAIFFFVIGLEIKRELMVGELSSFRKALFPISAALGGMLFPAIFYLLFNFGEPGASGWGIPMATDIAFALGILALIGRRAPLPLKIFLTAVAIVDDIGAILIIALFYTENIVWASLGLGLLVLLALMLLNRLGIRRVLPYSILGILLWFAFLKSGVHATVAGVLLAMTIPASTVIDLKGYVQRSRRFLNQIEDEGTDNPNAFTTSRQRALLQAIEDGTNLVEAPLQNLEHALHPWVAFLIMPLFALANAGVYLQADLSAAFTDPITLGIVFGLVLGKPIGISLMAILVTRLGLAKKIQGVSWRQIYGAAMLAGIGFTMSLFISSLAFSEAALLTNAKIGILGASLFSAIAGWVLLTQLGPEAD